MTSDAYPYSYLWPRLLYFSFFCIALGCLIFAIVFGIFSKAPMIGLVRGAGAFATIIVLLLQHFQKTKFESSPIEMALLSNGLRVRGLNKLARWRNKSAQANVYLAILGVFVTTYGIAWGPA